MSEAIESGAIEVGFPSDTRFLHLLANLTRDASLLAGFPRRTAEEVALAVDEAVTNVIRHSYHGERGREIRLDYHITVEYLKIRILHGGDQVDLSRLQPPDPQRYIAERRRGGLGLVLMTRLMDKVEFDQRREGEHECSMWKYRGKAPAPRGGRRRRAGA
jgi:serine/threonine-protein kinase RsbW